MLEMLAGLCVESGVELELELELEVVLAVELDDDDDEEDAGGKSKNFPALNSTLSITLSSSLALSTPLSFSFLKRSDGSSNGFTWKSSSASTEDAFGFRMRTGDFTL